LNFLIAGLTNFVANGILKLKFLLLMVWILVSKHFPNDLMNGLYRFPDIILKHGLFKSKS